MRGPKTLMDVLDRVLDRGVVFETTRLITVPSERIEPALAEREVAWVLPPAGPSGAAPLAAPADLDVRRQGRAVVGRYRRPID